MPDEHEPNRLPCKRVPASRRSPLRYSSIGRHGTLYFESADTGIIRRSATFNQASSSSGRKGFVRKSSAPASIACSLCHSSTGEDLQEMGLPFRVRPDPVPRFLPYLWRRATHRGFDRVQKMKERTRVKGMTDTDPMTCVDNSVNPPPKNKPCPVGTPVNLSSAKNPTQIVPNTPFARWTARALTRSSIFRLSKNPRCATLASEPAVLCGLNAVRNTAATQ